MPKQLSHVPISTPQRLTVLEPGPGLIRAAQGRKEHGVSLQTVVIGTEHGDLIFVGLTLFRRTL